MGEKCKYNIVFKGERVYEVTCNTDIPLGDLEELLQKEIQSNFRNGTDDKAYIKLILEKVTQRVSANDSLCDWFFENTSIELDIGGSRKKEKVLGKTVFKQITLSAKEFKEITGIWPVFENGFLCNGGECMSLIEDAMNKPVIRIEQSAMAYDDDVVIVFADGYFALNKMHISGDYEYVQDVITDILVDIDPDEFEVDDFIDAVVFPDLSKGEVIIIREWIRGDY